MYGHSSGSHKGKPAKNESHVLTGYVDRVIVM